MSGFLSLRRSQCESHERVGEGLASTKSLENPVFLNSALVYNMSNIHEHLNTPELSEYYETVWETPDDAERPSVGGYLVRLIGFQWTLAIVATVDMLYVPLLFFLRG
ncbi:hypothetical protein I4U23_010800 [Adineta vaga]|nr:hypothetical protein I4U23_010800 [Adineta vaga]